MRNTTQKIINKAKIQLMSTKESTFFSALLSYLRIIPSTDIPTARVTAKHLYINEDFLESLTTAEVVGVLTHEVMHIALEHLGRAKEMKLDHRIYNIAGDYYINNYLVSRNIKLPSIALVDRKYSRMSTLEIYNDLIENAVNIESFIEDILSNPEYSEEDKEDIKSKIISACQQANIQGDPGSVPGFIQRRVQEMVEPKLPWTQILSDKLVVYTKDDYTWVKPNKRYWPDVYLPGMLSKSLDELYIGLDVSGSITQKDLDIFMSEIKYIWEVMKPRLLTLVSFDTEIHHNETYGEGDTLDDLVLQGGGGTYIGPIIEDIVDKEPTLAIIFSDMEFSNPYLDSVKADLIWVRSGEHPFNPSKGEVIQYE